MGGHGGLGCTGRARWGLGEAGWPRHVPPAQGQGGLGGLVKWRRVGDTGVRCHRVQAQGGHGGWRKGGWGGQELQGCGPPVWVRGLVCAGQGVHGDASGPGNCPGGDVVAGRVVGWLRGRVVAGLGGQGGKGAERRLLLLLLLLLLLVQSCSNRRALALMGCGVAQGRPLLRQGHTCRHAVAVDLACRRLALGRTSPVTIARPSRPLATLWLGVLCIV